MKITVITVTYNSEHTVADTLASVLRQTYQDIEYLVVDGCSTDGTLAVVKSYEERFGGRMKWISEPDGGIYDAMNKGISMATGDVVGILNSDDYFTADDVVERFAGMFGDEHLDAVYGDVHFIKDGHPDKCVRYYSSALFRPFWLRFGFMPAHPSFYARKRVFERAGLYKTDYAIGSDFEMMARLFHNHHIKARYLPFDFVTMRVGGTSTRNVRSRLTLIDDDVRGCRENGIYTNRLFICLKYLYKIFEFRF